MKSKTIFYISEIANLIMIYVIIMAVSTFALMMINERIDVWQAISVLLLVFGIYVIRIKCKNIILYIISYLVLCVPVLLISLKSSNYGMVLIYELVFLMINMWWFATKLYYGCAYISVYVVALFAILFIAADVKGNKPAMDLFFVYGIVFFFMNYLRLFFTNVNLFSREKERNVKMPYSEMVRNDSKLAFPFILGSILMMALLKVDFLDTWFGKAYMKLIVYVRYGLVYIIETLDMLFKKLFRHVPVEPMHFDFGETTYQASSFENILSSIIMFILTIAVIGLIVVLIVKFFNSFSKREFHSEQNIDEIGMVEIRERIQRKKVKKEKLSSIRKQYKQTVEKCAKKGCTIYRTHTPEERKVHIKSEIKQDISELTAKYVKERYSKGN